MVLANCSLRLLPASPSLSLAHIATLPTGLSICCTVVGYTRFRDPDASTQKGRCSVVLMALNQNDGCKGEGGPKNSSDAKAQLF